MIIERSSIAPVGVFTNSSEASDWVEKQVRPNDYSILKYGVDALIAYPTQVPFKVRVDCKSSHIKGANAVYEDFGHNIIEGGKSYFSIYVHALTLRDAIAQAKSLYRSVCENRNRFPRLRKGIQQKGEVYYPKYDVSTGRCIEDYGSGLKQRVNGRIADNE